MSQYEEVKPTTPLEQGGHYRMTFLIKKPWSQKLQTDIYTSLIHWEEFVTKTHVRQLLGGIKITRASIVRDPADVKGSAGSRYRSFYLQVYFTNVEHGQIEVLAIAGAIIAVLAAVVIAYGVVLKLTEKELPALEKTFFNPAVIVAALVVVFLVVKGKGG